MNASVTPLRAIYIYIYIGKILLIFSATMLSFIPNVPLSIFKKHIVLNIGSVSGALITSFPVAADTKSGQSISEEKQAREKYKRFCLLHL